MSVRGEEARRLAALARVRLEPGEAETVARDLGRILAYVENLQALQDPEASGASDPPGPPGQAASGRLDTPGPEGAPGDGGAGAGPDLLRYAPEAMAPRWADGFFLVPPPRGVDPDEA